MLAKLCRPKAYPDPNFWNRAYPATCVSSELLRACFRYNAFPHNLSLKGVWVMLEPHRSQGWGSDNGRGVTLKKSWMSLSFLVKKLVACMHSVAFTITARWGSGTIPKRNQPQENRWFLVVLSSGKWWLKQSQDKSVHLLFDCSQRWIPESFY